MSQTLHMHRSDSGIALPIALLAILLITVLGAGIWMTVSIGARSTFNRQDSADAVQLAEAGVAHAELLLRQQLDTLDFSRILRGSDNVAGNGDDGILAGFGLASDEQIPTGGRPLGGGLYRVVIKDDRGDLDGDPNNDSNLRVMIRSTGVSASGARALVEAVVNDGEAAFVPSMVTEGDLTVDGNPTLVGSCGGVHSNDDVYVSGTLTVTQTVAAADSVTVSGSIVRPDGTPVTPQENKPGVQIPDYPNPTTTFCSNGEADYYLQADGWILRTSDNSLHDARTSKQFGWLRTAETPTKWELAGNAGYPGTYCVSGNVLISGNPDAGSGAPLSLTVIASKSIEVTGNPKITADHPDDILLMAGSDVKISGNLAGDPGDYSGLIYARAQCDLRGNANISSRVLCKNGNNASGAFNLVDVNGLGGNVLLDYDCNATVGVRGPRRVYSWAQVFD